MGYCTGRLPALRFSDRRSLAYLELCAKSALDLVGVISSAICCDRHHFTDGPPSENSSIFTIEDSSRKGQARDR